MRPRILVIGGLKEPGLWDGFARHLGTHLRQAGASLAVASASGFGIAMRAGYEGSDAAANTDAPAPDFRIHAAEGAQVPSAVADAVFAPLAPEAGAGSVEVQALRDADVLLVAGNGSYLKDTVQDAARRGIPVVPLPIEQSTSEDLWEEHLRTAKRPFPNADLRNAFMGLRRPDPRRVKLAESLAELLVGLATAPEIGGGPHILVVAPPGPSDAVDEADAALRRGLRAHAPGAVIEHTSRGHWSSPGRAFIERVTGADLVVAHIGDDAATALYALGLARGAGTPTLALAWGDDGGIRGLDPGALDLLRWTDARLLAVQLDRRLPKLLKDKVRKVAPKRARPGRGKGSASAKGPRSGTGRAGGSGNRTRDESDPGPGPASEGGTGRGRGRGRRRPPRAPRGPPDGDAKAGTGEPPAPESKPPAGDDKAAGNQESP